MKKIVAIVLAMVMVLGLATTAFAYPAAEPTSLGFFWKTTTGDDAGSLMGVGVTDATAPKDLDKTGIEAGTVQDDEAGNVKYFSLCTPGAAAYDATKYVQVATVAEADVILYYAKQDALGNYSKSDSVFMYLDQLKVNEKYLGTGVAFDNFGDACGQYDDTPVADTKYYVFQNTLYKAVTASTAATSLMIDGKLTSVEALPNEFVGHTAVMTYDKDYTVTAIKCADCGVVANIVTNFASLPKAMRDAAFEGILFFPVNDGGYYYWTQAVEAPAADAETDKVESAETFDAGIAMYVGMSVMAAAGSAVVLKKKD